MMNGEVPCRLTARASPFASHGPRLAGDGAHGTGARAERQTRMIGGGHMDAERDAERDTDGTMDAHEGVLLQCLFDRFGSVFPQCGLMVFPGVVIVSR